MIRTGTSAYVPVRIMIDASSEPSSCIVQAEESDERFRKAVCDGLSRVFGPSLDASGTPAASVYHTAVVYILG
jgi:hypothetical protein